MTLMQAELARLRDLLLASARHSNPKRLTHHGYKVYSQNDEDGMVAEIFKRVGLESRRFVEFGVGNGLECNSLWLLMQGWTGLWLQGDRESCDAIERTHATFVAAGRLIVQHEFVTCENINQILGSIAGKPNIDFLSVDVDRNDYWIWEALEVVRPRVVAIEYNATWVPPTQMIVPYAAYEVWNGTNYFGASLAALAALGARKGYSLVGCCLAGVNAFFVRNDLIKPNQFIAPGDVSEHYEPARYYFADLPSGHPPGIGQVVFPNAT